MSEGPKLQQADTHKPQHPDSTQGTKQFSMRPTSTKPTVRECGYKAPVHRTIDDFIYDKDKKIGEGTYGKVFKARDKSTNEVVALKEILISQKESGLPITSIREIKLLKSLRHDNIVTLKEVVLDSEINRNRESECIYLVFEFMEHDLSGLNKCEGSRFVLGQVRCYAKQLLEGLYHCHKKNILHRDIKGANMLINKDGILKLADFGLARRMKEELGGRYTRPVVTLWYRAPELLLGTKTYGPSIDMWSVGCLLVELYTGKALFPGTTEADQIDRIYQICGTPASDNWPQGREMPAYKNFRPKEARKRHLRRYLQKYSNSTITQEAIDLIDKLLSLDPALRPTAEEALDHAYFYKPTVTMTPSSLPKYPGQLNELFSKRAREAAPREEPPAKRFRDNDGRSHHRGNEHHHLGRDDYRHRDNRGHHNRGDHGHDRRRPEPYRRDRDFRGRGRDNHIPYGNRDFAPRDQSHIQNRLPGPNRSANLSRSPTAPVQPLPPRDYRERDLTEVDTKN